MPGACLHACLPACLPACSSLRPLLILSQFLRRIRSRKITGFALTTNKKKRKIIFSRKECIADHVSRGSFRNLIMVLVLVRYQLCPHLHVWAPCCNREQRASLEKQSTFILLLLPLDCDRNHACYESIESTTSEIFPLGNGSALTHPLCRSP
jgi:hypothetical protein